MKHFVVTIGREFGSRGLLIGKKLGELLGVKCYDKEIAQMAGDELNMYRSDLSSLDEVFSNQTFRFLRFTGGAELERFDKLQETQARIIKEIAERESSFSSEDARYVGGPDGLRPGFRLRPFAGNNG
jgi:hypothetical protein